MNDQRPTIDEFDIPDLLANLVDRSLVVVDPETWRYDMTESMRAFLMEQPNDDLQQVRTKYVRYAEWFAEQILESTYDGFLSQAQIMFDHEAINLRSAFECGMDHDPSSSLHIAACSCTNWYGPTIGEAVKLFTRSLERAPQIDDLDHAWARLSLAGDYIRLSRLKESQKLLDILRAQKSTSEDPRVQVMTHELDALIALARQESDRAKECLHQALDIAEKHDLKFLQSNEYSMLGELARSNGDTKGAEHYYEEALRLAPMDSFYRSIILVNLALNAIQEGHLDHAEKQLLEALSERRKTGSFFDVAAGALGLIHILNRNYETGATLLGHLYHLKARLGTTFDAGDAELFNGVRAKGEADGGESFQRGWNASKTITADQLARLIDGLY